MSALSHLMTSDAKPATYADIEALPDNVVGEIIKGVLYASPRPAIPHAHASSALGYTLGPAFHYGDNGPGGWIILFEPECHLGADVLVPDLAGWRRERMAKRPDSAAIKIAPDWVCEVLSPSTALIDRGVKLEAYGEHGVGWVWLIDPKLKLLEVLKRTDEGWLFAGSFAKGQIARAQPFEAVAISLARLWGDEDESTAP